MVIDFHAHYRREPGFIDRLLEAMPPAGIDRICLCSAGEDLWHVSNSEVLAAARCHPDHIIALALVELGKDAPERVDEYAAAGFRGFKITNPRASYDDDAFFPVYERMERSGLPLLAHTGILLRFPESYRERVNSNWMRPICLDAVVRAFPRLNVVAAHLGMPWHEEASSLARVPPNFYVDLTGAAWGGWRVNKDAAFYRYHFFWDGAWDKVVFGTDILSVEDLEPARGWHDRIIEDLSLPEAVVANIYGATAARLLGLRS